MPCLVLLTTQRSPRAAAGSQRRGCPRWHLSALTTRRSRLVRHSHACRCWVRGWSNMISPGMNSLLVLQVKKRNKAKECREEKGLPVTARAVQGHFMPCSGSCRHQVAGRGAPSPTAPDKDAVPSQGTKQKAWLGTEERLFTTRSHRVLLTETRRALGGML